MKLNLEKVRAERRRSVMEAAKEAGFLTGENISLGARTPRMLVEQAKERSGISSTTELIEYALAKLALEDDFGAKLAARRGSIPAGIKLEI